jgi:long-subunit acyl-CoA synthetase (AMP-forming)
MSRARASMWRSVPMYPPLRWSEIEEHVRGCMGILANAQARVHVTVPEGLFIGRILKAQLPDLAAVVSVDRLGGNAPPAETPLRGRETAMLQYTSGSTGHPKGQRFLYFLIDHLK